MKKWILDKEGCLPVINRVNALMPASQGLWGTMTVNDMLFHCAKINNEIRNGKSSPNKSTLKQKFFRSLVLRIMKSLPKGIKTNPKYVKPKEDDTAFEELRKSLIDSVNQFANHNTDLYGSHPLLGPLKTLQWRRFVYMHLDYHLRQFGV